MFNWIKLFLRIKNPTWAKSPRRLCAILFGILWLICVVLAFWPVESTEIGLNAAVTAFAFGPTRQTPLVDRWRVQGLGVVGFTRANLPDIENISCCGADRRIHLKALPDPRLPGSVTVQSVQVPKDSKVYIESSSRSALRINCQVERLIVTVQGRVQIDSSDEGPQEQTWRVSRPFTFESTEALDIDISLDDSQSVGFAPIPINWIDLNSRVRHGDGPAITDRQYSAIKSANLLFHELGAREGKIRAGEALSLDVAVEPRGRLSMSGFKDEEFRIQYDGKVKAVEVSRPVKRNLMPNWLEYLYAQATLGYLITIAGTLFALYKGLVSKSD